jgi:hypothetical protein
VSLLALQNFPQVHLTFLAPISIVLYLSGKLEPELNPQGTLAVHIEWEKGTVDWSHRVGELRMTLTCAGHDAGPLSRD